MTIATGQINQGCTWCSDGIARIGDISDAAPDPRFELSASVGQGGANRFDDVKRVQQLLNDCHAAVGAPAAKIGVDGFVGYYTVRAIRDFQSSRLGFADGRIDPGQKTIDEIEDVLATSPSSNGSNGSVKAFGGFRRLSFGSSSAPKSTPKQRAIQTVPLALNWVLLARAQLLAAHGKAPGHQLLLPTINTHFHIDRSPTPQDHLKKTIDVFGHMRTVLMNPAPHFQDGTSKKGDFAIAPMGGFHLSGYKVTFCPPFLKCGPFTRAAMIVHELAHFCGLTNEIDHFAREIPLFDGAPDGPGKTRNYAQLLTHEAVRNATSYAAYAIHASMGVDHRFGARDIKL